MKHKAVKVQIPGSTANLGPGFDTLGMALTVYAHIEMRLAEQTVIELYGDEMDGVPTDETNLVYQTAQSVFKAAGVGSHPLHITIRSDIPMARGLGSSAAAIVGSLAAANALLAEPLSGDHLFQMAVQLEQHPDNVGASMFGGI